MRLDALYEPSAGDPFAKSEAERGQAGNRLEATRSAPAVPVRPSRGAIDASEPVRILNERYGSGWRYEIADRRREADEVIVLCKLVIDETGATKSQFGSAFVGNGDRRQQAFGTANGVAFGVATSANDETAGPAMTEDAAYERAVAAALSKCVALL